MCHDHDNMCTRRKNNIILYANKQKYEQNSMDAVGLIPIY